MSDRMLPARRWSGELPAPRHDAADADTVDVAELARGVARGWRAVIAGALLGLLAAFALVLFWPARYQGLSSVLLRNANDPTGSLLSRFGIAGDIASSAGGGLGSVLKSPMETELQLLGSRDVLGEVVDSLGLQARVKAPRGVPARRLLEPARYAGSFRRVAFDFARESAGAYRARGAGADVVLRPGVPATLPVVGRVTLAAGALPESFRIQFEDREDAITRLEDRITIDKKGGEVVEVDYSGPDSLTAAAVPNAVVSVYLQRRRTVDRGLNQRRFEFLSAQVDSVAGQLVGAELALRSAQERSGVLDPEISGKATVEGLQQLREELDPIRAQQLAAREVVRRVEQGQLAPRELSAFPSFLASPAISSLMSQLNALEVERTRLLERRTERDPDVTELTQSIAQLDRQFLPLARTYAASLDRQVAALGVQEAALERQIAALPGGALGVLQRQREVKRLSQTSLALQAQLIDTRLAALTEGGQVRQVDFAHAPKRIRFPRPLPTLGVGLALGLMLGVLGAALGGGRRGRVATTGDAERAAGLPVYTVRSGDVPLLGAAARRGVVVVSALDGADAEARRVAAALVAQARERGQHAAFVDAFTLAPGADGAREAAQAVRGAASGGELTVVAAPDVSDRRAGAVLDPESCVVLLVGCAGALSRRALVAASDTLARADVATLGVVLVHGHAAGSDAFVLPPAAGPNRAGELGNGVGRGNGAGV
ncbi:MAG TPA: Wzz/FepE/Etk N-terminal domain-containing protein [Gemmatirosa sp.]|nr:Wzz/FepE/Etk N-terminal domain-containing protein [Gemmatirosa sp.]